MKGIFGKTRPFQPWTKVEPRRLGPTCKRGGVGNDSCPPPYLKFGQWESKEIVHLSNLNDQMGKAEKLIMGGAKVALNAS